MHFHLTALILSVTLATVLASADESHGKSYGKLVETLDHERIAHDYPKAVQDLDSDDPKTVMAGLRTLAATGEPAVIPWIVPLLDANDPEVRIWAGSSLQKVVSAYELRRRDLAQPGRITFKPRGPNDYDLRPLAPVIRAMLQKPDDGNTHSYAATMIGYLHLREFEPELRKLLESRHPAVTNATKVALEMIGVQLAFPEEELASAKRVGESFGELFRRNDEDNLGLLLLPKEAIPKVLHAGIVEKTGADALYTKMVKGNTQRFREFRSMFNDLSKTDSVTFQPGHMTKSEFYADDVRVLKNSFVTFAYSNRVVVKIKIEEMVCVDGAFFIVEID